MSLINFIMYSEVNPLINNQQKNSLEEKKNIIYFIICPKEGKTLEAQVCIPLLIYMYLPSLNGFTVLSW